MLDGIAGSFASSPFSNAASDWCAGDSVRKISVLPHQTITSRSSLLSALNFRMSAMSCSARSFLFLPFLTFGPSSRLTYCRSNTAGIGLIADSSSLIWSSSAGFEHAGRLRRLVAVVLEDVPAAEHELVEPGERHEVTDGRRPAFGALAEPDRAHLRERADGLGEALADRHDAGDGRRADGAETDEQNAELALGGSDGYSLSHGAKLYHSAVRSAPVLAMCRRTGARCDDAQVRAGPSPYQTAVAMVGARAGDRVLVDRRRRRGSGRRCRARDRPHRRRSAGRSAPAPRRASRPPPARGALVEFAEAPPAKLPFDPDTFDVVLIAARRRSPNDRRRRRARGLPRRATRRTHRRHRSRTARRILCALLQTADRSASRGRSGDPHRSRLQGAATARGAGGAEYVEGLRTAAASNLELRSSGSRTF